MSPILSPLCVFRSSLSLNTIKVYCHRAFVRLSSNVTRDNKKCRRKPLKATSSGKEQCDFCQVLMTQRKRLFLAPTTQDEKRQKLEVTFSWTENFVQFSSWDFIRPRRQKSLITSLIFSPTGQFKVITATKNIHSINPPFINTRQFLYYLGLFTFRQQHKKITFLKNTKIAPKRRSFS